MKTQSIFFPNVRVQTARDNAVRYPWGAAFRRQIVQDAEPWRQMADEDVWGLMIGPAPTRSWFVVTDGQCPACQQDVPGYTWVIDPFEHPWKVQCPHCRELFPKNDFAAYHRSGLDEHGVFRADKADRSLLFNAAHPQPGDPLRLFGVDDGEGYAAEGRRWRFIGAYLIHGQWKRLVLGGLQQLGAAYVVTGEPIYAHKAGILLDRVADLYPTFDFAQQAVVYEKPAREEGAEGYVSIWHDACVETKILALVYDQVFEGMRQDDALPQFLARMAKRYGVDNPKTTFLQIQSNTEERIFREALAHPQKIRCNPPVADLTVLTLRMILDWPADSGAITDAIVAMLKKTTVVDGLTGEKGVTDYAVIAPMVLGSFLAHCDALAPDFLSRAFRDCPALRQTFRFHIETWCLDSYYPSCGDAGWFAGKEPQYAGDVGEMFQTLTDRSALDKRRPLWREVLAPSMFAFMGRLYDFTGDAVFPQLVWRVNGKTAAGLPHDIFADDPAGFQKKIEEVVRREGPEFKVGSVNRTQWHLAILRSGLGREARALWLDYDSGGCHAHMDGMNLGLFAKGLDLLPDFGYPPTLYGGWWTPQAGWYPRTCAHHTVSVDGRDHKGARFDSASLTAGRITLWADGRQFRAMRASGAAIIGGQQFERTAVLIDISDADFYVVDILRVVGGTRHDKFVRSHFGRLRLTELPSRPIPDLAWETPALMRHYRQAVAPSNGWSAVWEIEDAYGYLAPGHQDVRLRYWDLTGEAQVFTAESWVNAGHYYTTRREAWVPTLIVRRAAAEAPLASTYVAVLAPEEGGSPLAAVRRVPLADAGGAEYGENQVGVEVRLADGRRDLLIAMDVENPLGRKPSWRPGGEWRQREEQVAGDGELAWIRYAADGRVERMALCQGRMFVAGATALKTKTKAEFIAARWRDGQAVIE